MTAGTRVRVEAAVETAETAVEIGETRMAGGVVA